jgi:hypothetical protein
MSKVKHTKEISGVFELLCEMFNLVIILFELENSGPSNFWSFLKNKF